MHSLLNSLKSDTLIPFSFCAFQDPGFSGYRFFWAQVFQGPCPGFRSGPKVDCCFKLFTFTSWYLCLQFFFFKHQHKNIHTKLDSHFKVFTYLMIFVFREVLLIHNNLVTQKIAFCKIIDQSCKWCSIFI